MSTGCFLPYIGLGSCLLHMSYIHEFGKKEGPITILTFSKSLADTLKFDSNIKKIIVVEKFHKNLFDIFKLSHFLKNLMMILKSYVNFLIHYEIQTLIIPYYHFYFLPIF